MLGTLVDARKVLRSLPGTHYTQSITRMDGALLSLEIALELEVLISQMSSLLLQEFDADFRSPVFYDALIQ